MTAKPQPPTPALSSPTLLSRWYPGARLASCSALRVAGMVPVVMVLGVMALAYLCAVVATLIPLLPHAPAFVYPLLLLFHFVFLNTIANYLLLVILDPGSPPEEWSASPPPPPPPRRQRHALAEARQLVEAERMRERLANEEEGAAEGETLLTQRHADAAFQPQKHVFRFAHLMHERAYDGSLRYCRVCKAYKPDRSHHCSVCRRCILRMDHHCVFVNNCVSFYNHKFFISFVTYAFLGCLFVSVVSFPTFVAIVADEGRPATITQSGSTGGGAQGWSSHDLWDTAKGFAHVEHLSTIVKTLAMVGYITSAAFAFALAVFVVLHFYLVSKGRTTIEMYELTDPSRAARVAEYDLGAAKNCRNIFGSTPLCWFFPTRAYVEGDGLEWERRVATDRHAFNV